MMSRGHWLGCRCHKTFPCFSLNLGTCFVQPGKVKSPKVTSFAVTVNLADFADPNLLGKISKRQFQNRKIQNFATSREYTTFFWPPFPIFQRYFIDATLLCPLGLQRIPVGAFARAVAACPFHGPTRRFDVVSLL